MIYIFGIKARTILWMLIGFVLFLIYTQVAFPHFWRKLYSDRFKKKSSTVEKKPLSNNEKKFQSKLLDKKPEGKSKVIISVVLVLFLSVACFYLGTLVGFDNAITSLPPKPCISSDKCQQFDCADIKITGCPGCSCSYCGESVLVSFPVK